jgi:hypothetical protein
VLEDYCDMVMETYRDFRMFMEAHRMTGGMVCCMTFWNLMMQKMGYSYSLVHEIASDDSAWDHNLCMDYDGFEHDGKTKVVQFLGGLPYIRNGEKLIRFSALHCWGLWKEKMGYLMELAEASRG